MANHCVIQKNAILYVRFKRCKINKIFKDYHPRSKMFQMFVSFPLKKPTNCYKIKLT